MREKVIEQGYWPPENVENLKATLIKLTTEVAPLIEALKFVYETGAPCSGCRRHSKRAGEALEKFKDKG